MGGRVDGPIGDGAGAGGAIPSPDRPGLPWTGTYWDALRYYYWSVRYVGLKGIPRSDLVRDGDWIKVPAHHLKDTRGVYVREVKAPALEADLHRDEVTLNQVLSTTLAIAADAVIGRLLARPLGLAEAGPFERIGDEIAGRYGWGGGENVTQQDGFYVGPASAVALEIKIGAPTTAEQVLKYAALHAWEEMRGGPGKGIGLLYVVPEAHRAGLWRRAGLTGPGDVPALLDRLPAMTALPRRLREFAAAEPGRLGDVLGRLRVGVISWSELHAEIGAIRAGLGGTPGDETLDRLLAGLTAQIGAHEGTGVG